MRKWDVILPMQIRAARSMLSMSMSDLAAAADVSMSSIRRMEGEQGCRSSSTAMRKVLATLEAMGVLFFMDGKRIGVSVIGRATDAVSLYKIHDVLRPR